MNRAEYLRKRRLQGVTSQIRRENDRLRRAETRLQRLKANFEIKRRQHTQSVEREMGRTRAIRSRIDSLESKVITVYLQ